MIGYGNSMFLATHGILARSASGGGVDPDAQAFITAASITDPTQQAAINQLVVDLKGYNIWSKFSALYPMVGGTNSKHSWNLKNTAQYQISWQGGVTSSANGVQFNGVNSYGNTGYIPTVVGASINSFHVSLYSRTNTNTGVDMGVQRGTTYILNVARSAGQAYTYINSQSGEIYSNSDGTGFYLGNRQAVNDSDAWKNGVKQVNGTSTTNPPEFANIAIFIGAFNSIGTAAQFTNRQLAFASIGDGLTDTEAANFYTAVQAFQTTLGRSIGTQTVSDADAQAFVTNAGIVDQVEANAINNLVIGLKADGLWTKMKAVYPMVGGTSTTTSYNLRNTAQYQISWAGSVTWNSNGVTFGINGYGNTNFLDSNLTIGSGAMGGYSRTNNNVSAYDMGLYNSSLGKGSYMGFSRNAATFDVLFQSFGATTEGSASNTNGTGFYSAGKNAVNSLNGYKNGTSLISATKADTTAVGQNIYIGTLNNNNSPAFGYSQRNWAFAFISDGLNATENSNLNTRVTTFQTALNRNV